MVLFCMLPLLSLLAFNIQNQIDITFIVVYGDGYGSDRIGTYTWVERILWGVLQGRSLLTDGLRRGRAVVLDTPPLAVRRSGVPFLFWSLLPLSYTPHSLQVYLLPSLPTGWGGRFQGWSTLERFILHRKKNGYRIGNVFFVVVRYDS
ncbi:hypothetical protein BS50DRAFT_197981 [Corynespora cassiicola Philippines]|uniref:Uncharacterized protein n=1 Tax=Corynespora cassiicola Philippines TaxID=1448308 RepID=A0A2T2N5Y6_CORCC|nr:hypothetical protein BS50DRAFT_197981 [Corynespora cassiicola Philippines]